jgi:ABC-type nitrate/sulfonate/bicarbonate transport system ATPase subunit
MIDVHNLGFAYPDQPPLFEDFTWQVAADEAWAVIGPSGCGKSTLLYLLAGLKVPTQGKIHVSGERLVRPRPRTGLILQDYGLLPWATVFQNAALGLRVRRLYGPDGRHAPAGARLRPEEASNRVRFWLERLEISDLGNQYPAQISGGQRQRTAIARTLAMNPELLLMDEPFSSLDALSRENLEHLTLELRAETGVTTVVVTHNIEEAVYMGQRLLLLRKPPHREALVIENPEAGEPDYREKVAFGARCSQIRELLGTISKYPKGASHVQTR